MLRVSEGLLKRVTDTNAEQCITQNVIERAGLRETESSVGPHVSGPHSQMYEAWFGMMCGCEEVLSVVTEKCG